MARGSQFLRQWRILTLLSSRRYGITLEELAKELEYHPRTIRRDLEVLEGAGFYVERERDPASRVVKVKLPAHMKAPPIPFTLSEILSFYFSSNLLKCLRGTPFKEGIDSAIQKIEKSLPVHVLDHVSAAENALLAKPGPLRDYRVHVDSLSNLQQAVTERRKTEVTYRAYGWDKAVRFKYHPYGVTYVNGAIYVIGHSEYRQAIRTLLLDRVEHVALNDGTFELPTGFDVNDYLGESFGVLHEGKTWEVVIEFSRDEAQGIREREWHPTQKIKVLKDGRTILSMKVAGLPQVVRWVLSYGSGARVIAPPDLSMAVARDLRAAARQYTGSRRLRARESRT